MTQAMALRISGLLGAAAVGLGAFGAHGLKDLLARHGTEGIWEKAVFYHFVHVLALLVLAFRGSALRGPFLCFVAGILVFSGSLYLLAVTNLRWLGAITPIGGISFIAGWLWLAICAPRTIKDGA